MILKVNAEELARNLALMDMALDEVPCEVHETADFEWYTSLYDKFFSVIIEHAPELEPKVERPNHRRMSMLEWIEEFNPCTDDEGGLREFTSEMLDMGSLHKDSKRVWTRYRRDNIFYVTTGRHRLFAYCYYVTEKEFEEDILIN